MFQKIINKLNDLRPRQLLMLASGAALLMFLAIYISMSFLQRDEIVQELAEKKALETVDVVVAKVNIPPRTRIQKSMLQVKTMPVELVPDGIIKSTNDVVDVQVKASIYAGDILTIQKVFAEKNDEGFVATIPLDSRAVSISVNDITGVAGFAKPGDFVDLLLVEKSQYSATTSILLQNIQLLSINKDMAGTSSGDDASTTAIKNPSIATFALRPEDTLKLISASKLGEIYMTLRPTKPNNMYVGEMEYTLESVNIPPQESKSAPTQIYEPVPEPIFEPSPEPTPVNPLPVIPSNQAPSAPLPQIPAAPSAPVAAPKIEIIQGDQITQEAEGSNPSAMPAIPAGIENPVASLPIVSGQSQVNNN